MTKWHVSGGVVLVFGLLAVLDWLDGPGQAPDPYVIYALLVVTGLAFGMKPPWSGGRGD